MNAVQATIATPASADDWRELARRDNDGIEVSLFWSKSADRVWVVVADTRLEIDFELEVAGVDALAAFHHPFSYLRSPIEAAVFSPAELEAA